MIRISVQRFCLATNAKRICVEILLDQAAKALRAPAKPVFSEDQTVYAINSFQDHGRRDVCAHADQDRQSQRHRNTDCKTEIGPSDMLSFPAFRLALRQHVDVAEIVGLRRIIQYRESGLRNDDVSFACLAIAVLCQVVALECDAEEVALAPDKAARAPQIVERQFEGDGQNRQTLLVNPCPAVSEVGKVDVTGAFTGLAAKKQRCGFADSRPAVGPSIIHLWYRSPREALPFEQRID
jgi:hypothetical protein